MTTANCTREALFNLTRELMEISNLLTAIEALIENSSNYESSEELLSSLTVLRMAKKAIMKSWESADAASVGREHHA